jgi:phosphatidylinositol alpha-1,6-mannosyltransferase
LGRLNDDTRYKGSERLLDVLARLPDSSFEAVIAGKGNDLEHLKAFSRTVGVQDRVIFTGTIDEQHMPDLYRSADAFYLVSEAGYGKGEGIPLTPLEAMACGAPVVVGNQDGSREILDEGGGLCCAPHDLESQTRYLLQLQEDKTWQQQERKTARARAEAVFGYPAFVAKTTGALASILCRASR